MSDHCKDARVLRDALRQVIVAHGALDDARRPCGAPLSAPHAYALMELLQSDEPMTVSELAKRLLIDRTNVSRLCARMEERGELVREEHPTDGRAWMLRLSAKGRRVANTVDQSSAQHFEGVVERLGAQRKEVLDALDGLRRALRWEEE